MTFDSDIHMRWP